MSIRREAKTSEQSTRLWWTRIDVRTNEYGRRYAGAEICRSVYDPVPPFPELAKVAPPPLIGDTVPQHLRALHPVVRAEARALVETTQAEARALFEAVGLFLLGTVKGVHRGATAVPLWLPDRLHEGPTVTLRPPYTNPDPGRNRTCAPCGVRSLVASMPNVADHRASGAAVISLLLRANGASVMCLLLRANGATAVRTGDMILLLTALAMTTSTRPMLPVEPHWPSPPHTCHRHTIYVAESLTG